MFATYPKADPFAPRVEAIVARWPADPVAVAATDWLLKITGGRNASMPRMLALLEQSQMDEPGLAILCETMEYCSSIEAQTFLRAVRERSPHPAARGWASYSLAKLLLGEARTVAKLQAGDEEHAAWLSEVRGAEAVDRLRHTDVAELRQQAASLLDQVVSVI